MSASIGVVKTLDSGASWLYVLSWPPGHGVEKKEAFVIPVFAREDGILMAVPLDFLPQEALVAGLNASPSDAVGPSLVIRCPGIHEADNGEEVPIGLEISCLLVDFSSAILPELREYDPVTDVGEILHFWPEVAETLPLSTSLQEQALDWIAQESDSRVHYYSAAEEEDPSKHFMKPGAKKPPAKPKKPTTAVLADQVAALSETLPAITSQLELLQANQERLEGVLNRGSDVQRPAHQTDFPLPPQPGAKDIKEFAKAVGAPPRTKTTTPLRQISKQLFPEDEPRMEPQQEDFKMALHVPPGDALSGGATQALIQQSQAMTALVAHLISQDSLGDLASSSSSSLSTRGTAKREKLQADLANRSGNFMLLVSQAAFRRMRPTDAMPSSLNDFKGRSLFTRYFEKQGGYQSHRDLALIQWMMAHIADALLADDVQGARDLTSLGMVMIDQACQDGGKWEVAYLLGLLEDPPPGIYAPRGRSTNPRLAAFSPLCPNLWATTTLSFIREMDMIASRRQEAAGPAVRKNPKSEEDPDKPAPKRRTPKFPKKPKQDPDPK